MASSVNSELQDSIRNVSVAVGTSAVLVSPQLQFRQRKALVITNTSTGGQVIYISFQQQPSATGTGIPLYPAGSWSESLDSAFTPANGNIWAIGSAISGTIAVHERITPTG